MYHAQMIDAATLPLSLYIHIPWCVRKCPYCDFNSHAIRSASTIPDHESQYIEALLADLAIDSADSGNRAISSIFIGGGTPSLLSGAAIARLLEGIEDHVTLERECEITLEANPGTVEASRFAAYRAAGVNRLSIGVQSFDDAQLKKLGRIHDARSAHAAIDIAKQAGFDNFNIDIMHGLNEQTIDAAMQDLSHALSHHPSHLSWYQLTIEPNTAFYLNPPRLPDDDLIWEMQLAGKTLLAQSQFAPYEISAYSRPGHTCQHNLNYWQFGDYLGIGAGAHGKLTNLQTHKITRTVKYRHPKDYLDHDKPFIQQQTLINPTALPFEFMLGALRLYQPITFENFEQRTGLTLEQIEHPLNQATSLGLLTWDKTCICLTEKGKRFVNDVVTLFMEETS